MSKYEGTITWLTVNWAREQFKDWVQSIYDDPRGSFADSDEAIAWERDAKGIAEELGYSYEDIVKLYTSPYERARMESFIIQGGGE